MDGPTWQDTVTAWATLCAVLVALGLGVVAEVRNARDRSARRKEGEARRVRAEAEQANRVAAWLEDRPGVIEAATTRIFAVAQNASGEPVWDVLVLVDQIEEFGEEEVPDRWGTRTVRIGMLPPGERVERKLSRTPPDANSPAPLAMTFRDNAGAWWGRDERGVLGRLPGPPSPRD